MMNHSGRCAIETAQGRTEYREEQLTEGARDEDVKATGNWPAGEEGRDAVTWTVGKSLPCKRARPAVRAAIPLFLDSSPSNWRFVTEHYRETSAQSAVDQSGSAEWTDPAVWPFFDTDICCRWCTFYTKHSGVRQSTPALIQCAGPNVR